MTEFSREISSFREAGESPILWQLIARELICAANVLIQRHATVEPWPEEIKWPPEPIDYERFHTSLTPALLLYAFAAENLIKGILVARGKNPTAGGTLQKEFRTHDLVRLFREAEITMTEPLESLLIRLRRIIESGKYPISTKPEPYAPEQVSAREIEHVGKLLEGLEDVLRTLTPLSIEKIDLMRLCCSTHVTT